jgi:hypothetical protein
MNRAQTNHEISFYGVLNGRSENNEMIKPIKISIFGKLNNLRTPRKLKYHQIRWVIKSISVIYF